MMNDQAQALRKLVSRKLQSELPAAAEPGQPRSAHIIAVTSGKGGVGKSNVTLNFALSLQQLGCRTLVFDADIGMANIDVLIGSPSPYSLTHVLHGTKTLQDIIQIGPGGLHYVPGGSGLKDLIDMPVGQIDSFLTAMDTMSEQYDVILFDTGAGLSKETLRFVMAADETWIVTTPEPTAIADAYAVMKLVSGLGHRSPLRLIVNRVSDWKEGTQTADRLTSVSERFLNRSLSVLGYIYDDPHVMQAVKKQEPFTILFPRCRASSQIRELARVYIQGVKQAEAGGATGGVKQVVRKWLRRWSL
ncbi:MinD/ParA family protein [Paenibacillus popilliae]|uniref:ATPase n=1 Tax=Paenibacillus popilliae ATCC 14706 TaxID=1212764 RepID=M9LBE7_PAEPP|nr:MinD/ParA family protein [Paenibacillus popilliae]GAC43147.1 ATPase [Paenibacillus popilliae ATCC 14706]